MGDFFDKLDDSLLESGVVPRRKRVVGEKRNGQDRSGYRGGGSCFVVLMAGERDETMIDIPADGVDKRE